MYPGVLWRGVKNTDIPPAFRPSHRQGEVVRYAAFTSGGRALDYPVQFRIISHDGRDISAFADPRFRRQREVLIPSGRLFEVENVLQDGTIVLRQITEEQLRGRPVHEFHVRPGIA